MSIFAWYLENEDLTLILRKKKEAFADTSAFNAGVKEKRTKTNKITIVKNEKLATQSFLFNMQIHFPFGNIYILFLLWKVCLNMIVWNICIVCFIIELHQFTSGTPYIPQQRKQNLQIWSLYQCRDRIVAVSRPLQIYTESANLIWAVLACFFFDFLFVLFVFCFFFVFFFKRHNVLRY